MIQTKKVAVVYLAWLPYGSEHFKSFLHSYVQFIPDQEHDLILVFNSSHHYQDTEIDEYLSLLKHRQIEAVEILKFYGGQDIEIYQTVAKMLDRNTLLFLNTFSQVQSPGWLRNYVSAFTPHVGLISASASCQSYYSSVFQKHPFKWESGKDAGYNFRKYKLFLKAFFYWRWLFKPFPNPHVRTNAFMVRREEFLQMKVSSIDTKFKAYLFENGRRSLTNYYLRKKMKVLVIGKNGQTYEPSEWRNSNTFWISNQENLLVSDNQTELYQHGSETERRSMTKLAWGI